MRMKILGIFAAGAAFVGLAIAGVAVASNFISSHHSDFYSPGQHQFTVFCADGSSKSVLERGSSAEDAQSKLYADEKAAGHNTCWPTWQGRVSG